MELTRREQRRKERQKIYNTKEWKLLREAVLRDSPLCVDCFVEGRFTPANEVHHIKSFMKFAESDPRRLQYAFDKSNCVALCKQCHIYRHHPELKDLNKYGVYDECDEEDDDTRPIHCHIDNDGLNINTDIQ